MLKTGIVSSAYFGYDDFKIGIKEMIEDGYNCCDYHGFIHANSPLYNFSEEKLKSYLNEIATVAMMAKMEFCQLHAQWPLACKTDLELLNSLELVKKSIRGAYYLNCPNVVVHTCSPYGWIQEVDSKKTFGLNVEFFKDLSQYAKGYNINICIENLPFLNLEISKVETVIKLIKAVKCDNCKMCFDTGHANVFHDDIAQDIKKIGSMLQVLHVHDNKGDYDSHMIPWQGTINWKCFSKSLKDIDFCGCISLETYIGKNMPSYFKKNLRKVLSEIAKNIADI